MKHYYPIPSIIRKKMDSGTLRELDQYLHPGVSGAIFQSYMEGFLKVLAECNIYTFEELTIAKDKVVNREYLSATKRQREVILGHHTYYSNELKRSEELWESLDEEQKRVAEHEGYVILIEDHET